MYPTAHSENITKHHPLKKTSKSRAFMNLTSMNRPVASAINSTTPLIREYMKKISAYFFLMKKLENEQHVILLCLHDTRVFPKISQLEF